MFRSGSRTTDLQSPNLFAPTLLARTNGFMGHLRYMIAWNMSEAPPLFGVAGSPVLDCLFTRESASFRTDGVPLDVRIGRPFMVETLRPIELNRTRQLRRHRALIFVPICKAVTRQKQIS